MCQMVADITRAEDAAEAMRGLLPNTRLQLSFGMHVIVTMGTFFALGYFGARMAFKSQYAVRCLT